MMMMKMGCHQQFVKKKKTKKNNIQVFGEVAEARCVTDPFLNWSNGAFKEPSLWPETNLFSQKYRYITYLQLFHH